MDGQTEIGGYQSSLSNMTAEQNTMACVAEFDVQLSEEQVDQVNGHLFQEINSYLGLKSHS